ncbi:MAG: FF domain protein [Parcubacteria bacterium C7867-004]|nr:MAG: FF domain protein [Parcubacteria bacterium C7867-004]
MEEPVINEREREVALELTAHKISIREWWFKDNALLTFAFNTSSATVPEGERFIVRAVEEAKGLVSDPVLREQADILVHEELAHAKMHDAYNRYLDAQGFPATKHVQETAVLLTFFERIFTLRMRLVTCMIIEHFTATYSKQVLDIGVLEGEDTDERMDRVWSWHCIEEVEHRSTAVDLYRAIGGGYFLRVLIGAFVSLAFLIAHARCLIDFLRAKNLLFTWHVWSNGVRYLIGKRGVYYLVLKYWLFYFKPGFHPNQIPIENRFNKQLHHYHIEDELVGYFDVPVK